ncbi:MAG: recombinase family protein [Cyanobacteria bacterium J06642_3]
MQLRQLDSLWIEGTTKVGKTEHLVTEFRQWVNSKVEQKNLRQPPLAEDSLTDAVLVFAANNQNRLELSDRLAESVEGTYPLICKTPVGFIVDEVVLFWPLIFKQLEIKAQFPLRLRPETEQELATKLWRDQPDWEILIKESGEYRFVRQTLDLLQLAGSSGFAPEEIPTILGQGFPERTTDPSLYSRMGELLLQWREWCLQRGLLTYGLIYELYWRYLLLNPQYQQHLQQRHQIIFADDTDDYPAIAADLFELLLDQGVRGVFTYNPDGQVRLGLNADPSYLQKLAQRCQQIELNSRGLSPKESKSEESTSTQPKVAQHCTELAEQLVFENVYSSDFPNFVQSIQVISRAELLRTTSKHLIGLVRKKGVLPQEIAIIAPGLDEIGRYTLIEMLSAQGIAVTPVNEQRPLISDPTVRSLLTLMALVYPGIGRLVERDAIAEMLTILSQTDTPSGLVPKIDPVRAGLIADHCYQVDAELPDLLSIKSFSRWDRLGNQAASSYQRICDWVEANKLAQQQSSVTAAIFLSKAINYFLGKSSQIKNHNTLASLRKLIESAQHYWEVDRRLRRTQPTLQTQAVTVANFITLLRRGTIAANHQKSNQFTTTNNAVSLSTIFQYRSLRTAHRFHYWLDAGSPLWEQGGSAILFGAQLFLHEWSGQSWFPDDQYMMDQQRLARIIKDLFGRVSEKVILCHSDLGVNGTEQMGALFPLVQAARQID